MAKPNKYILGLQLLVHVCKVSRDRKSSPQSLACCPNCDLLIALQLACLNHRGYCSRFSVLKYRTPLNYRPTYPPASYPPAAPYAGLTRFFSKKIKDRSLSGRLLRNLLYAEYLNKRKLTHVKIRHHKTEVVIMTKNLHVRRSVIKCDSDNDDDDGDEDSGSDDEDDSSSASSSNPFGYIRYFNPKNGSGMVQEPLRFESFVDYGEPARNQARVLEEPPKKPSIVLTSTAKLNLLHKQCSEDSEASSEMMPRNPGMACENLLTLEESFEMESLNVPNSYMPMTRQSCPTKLVGNKFSQSSLTTVYIPPWSSSENNIACRSRVSKSDSSSTTTHSSSLEVPVNTLPIPDKMVAELLYGEFAKGESMESDVTEQSQQTVINPPSMFKAPTSDTVSLNLETIPFRKHSINSDKPRRRCSIQINPTDLRNKALKRCVTSKFVNMRPHQAGTSRKPLCRCGSEYCHSPRSSDSGMAGSCTLNSPDLANSNDIEQEMSSNYMIPLLDQECPHLGTDISLSDIEARHFECECPCSSPFGSTPRTSSETSHTRDSLRTTSVTSVDMLPSQWGAQPQMHSTMASSAGPQKSKSTSSLLDHPDAAEGEAEAAGEEEEDSPMFRSGLYAHWWLKAKLPPEIVRAIYEGTREKSKPAEVSTGIRSKP